MMKVLFITRPDALTRPGGDTIQLQKTAAALEALGVQVRLGQPTAESLKWSDIVHVFNAQTPRSSLPALRAARHAGKPTVFSTIWWDLSHAQQSSLLSSFFGVPNPLWALSHPFFRVAVKTFRSGWLSEIRDTIRAADLLLPNSEEEMRCLRRDFGINLPPHRVVMNAVDTGIFRPEPSARRAGVICCARIEPTKNQLALIRAVAKMPDVKLTLIGRAGHHLRYNQRVRAEAARHNVTLIEDHLPQEEMVKLMHEHTVHALPSFRESPGLSSLEALASGLKIVVSSREFCPVDTYFGNWLEEHVFVCTPYSVVSLRAALIKALSQNLPAPPFPPSLTWPDVGQKTLEAYNEL